MVTIFHSITVLLYFGLNRSSLGEHKKSLFQKKEKKEEALGLLKKERKKN